ncbi:MAG: glycosyltransferase family 4 protein [Rubrivivax sp.]|nr:glycosyltransferase family 4 protein [Rubrivivax sp.]MDP3613545.1 glycosyltransferase family 4 protein [Rubrivivax sp.]
MANQCEQLVRLLDREGVSVELVRNNAPYRPAWACRLPGLRALFRLVPYLLSLWAAAGRVQVIHVFANSGWAWHLFAAPALLVARLRGRAVIVNYRGGHADTFFSSAPGHVLRSLQRATLRVTPSPFLQRVFVKHGLQAEVVPNIIDLTRFEPVPPRDFGLAPRIVVARNLEPIYDIATAIRAMLPIRQVFPHATLTVAGSGPELPRLKALVTELELQAAVSFTGRVENAAMPQLYALADCVVNPSTVDNMPISLLEAFASGLPVVSTDAGGIPDMLTHDVSGLLVPVGNAQAMGQEVCRVLQDRALATRLVAAGRAEAEKYAWPRVKLQWLDAYRRAAVAQAAA